jgi:hypothetical protein
MADLQSVINDLTGVASADVGDVLTKDANGNAIWSAPQGGSSSASFGESFDNDDLVNGILEVEHNLNQSIVHCTLQNNLGRAFRPDFVEIVDNNTIRIYMVSLGTITGTYKFLITK